MCAAKDLSRSSKKEIKQLIERERQSLASALDDVGQSRRRISATSSEIVHNPLLVVRETLANRLNSTQRWEAMGLAFLAGGAVAYMVKQKPGIVTAKLDAQGLISRLVEPLAEEFVDEAQLLGHRLIRDLFHSNDQGQAKTSNN